MMMTVAVAVAVAVQLRGVAGGQSVVRLAMREVWCQKVAWEEAEAGAAMRTQTVLTVVVTPMASNQMQRQQQLQLERQRVSMEQGSVEQNPNAAMNMSTSDAMQPKIDGRRRVQSNNSPVHLDHFTYSCTSR
jgi:hypothetical protein